MTLSQDRVFPKKCRPDGACGGLFRYHLCGGATPLGDVTSGALVDGMEDPAGQGGKGSILPIQETSQKFKTH